MYIPLDISISKIPTQNAQYKICMYTTTASRRRNSIINITKTTKKHNQKKPKQKPYPSLRASPDMPSSHLIISSPLSSPTPAGMQKRFVRSPHIFGDNDTLSFSRPLGPKKSEVLAFIKFGVFWSLVVRDFRNEDTLNAAL